MRNLHPAANRAAVPLFQYGLPGRVFWVFACGDCGRGGGLQLA